MSEHKESEPIEGIVTSDTQRLGDGISKRMLLIGSGFIILIVLIVIGILIKNIITKPKVVSTIQQVQNTASLNPQQQLAQAQSELKNATSSSSKATAYNDLGSAYATDKNFTQSINSYQSALSDNTNNDITTEFDSLSGLGYTYYLSGDIIQTISTYQKVISLLQKSNDPNAPRTITEYQNLIQQLQSTGEL
jgi:tetratricopeptide (TPR) repeat protein